MSAIKHAYLVRRLNRRARQQSENERMAIMETEARPLMYSVFTAALIVIAMILTSEYPIERGIEQAKPASSVTRVAA